MGPSGCPPASETPPGWEVGIGGTGVIFGGPQGRSVARSCHPDPWGPIPRGCGPADSPAGSGASEGLAAHSRDGGGRALFPGPKGARRHGLGQSHRSVPGPQGSSRRAASSRGRLHSNRVGAAQTRSRGGRPSAGKGYCCR